MTPLYVPLPLPFDRERPSAAAHRTSDQAEHSLLRVHCGTVALGLGLMTHICSRRRNRIPCTPVDAPTLILGLRLGIGFPQGKGGGGSKEGEAER
ncbi:hypothetical protein DFH07DRAFT_1055969 [Mycena maculata]|uniref:Uncharacterized protein n=1 Tax=Mycena maculata TaxID=230809 RepID=A0AAD7K6H6_9AGAR|nr:hypothetical protein DFH07DRAFT_1055969 [Mycena maculata]